LVKETYSIWDIASLSRLTGFVGSAVVRVGVGVVGPLLGSDHIIEGFVEIHSETCDMYV
jgi:hypothetical protein